ncbi:MAG: hypothetical protein J6C79_03820 [Clostridia bacterium]|nr:hypothetical protein [Clostridia bacterium]
MKKMRKALLLALSLAMSATLFAACGKDKDKGNASSSVGGSSEISSPVESESSSETIESESSEESSVESESSVSSEESSLESIESGSSEESSEESSEPQEVRVNVVKETVTGATIEGEDEAIVGEDYYFAVTFATGYEAGADFAVTIDGEAATYDETQGKYVVKDVAYGFMIEVVGVVEVSYDVTFACDVEGALLNENTTIKGTAAEYVFRISLAEKYSQSLDVVKVSYSVGDTTTEVTANENGEYVIANQNADITITVENVSLNTYDVQFAYNGDVKYVAQDVTVDTEVSAEDLAAAKDAVMTGVEGTFVGWDIPLGLVKGETTLQAVVAAGETESVATAFAATVETDASAPVGYITVSKETAVWAEENAGIGGDKTVVANIADLDVEPYKEIYFQMKVEKSWILFDGWSHYLANGDSERDGTIAVWQLITLKKNGTGWDVSFGGTTTFREGNNLKGILTFEYDARSAELGFDDCVPAEISVTEMIAVKDENYVHGTRETVVESLFVNATASEESAPYGYQKVYSETAVWNESKQSTGGVKTVWADLAQIDVAKYKTIKFQIKVEKSWVLFDGWSHYFAGNGQWTPVEMTKTGAGWDIAFAGGAGTVTSRSGNNLSTLLKMELDARSEELGYADCTPAQINVTELIGVLDENYVEPVKKDLVADSAYLAGVDINGSMFEATTEITAAFGFEKVYKYQSATAANIHGMNFDGTNLDEYSKVYFALKTSKFNCNAEKTLEGLTDWLYFELTQTAANTWDIKITYGGEVVYSGTGFNGAYNSEANPAYSNNAIDAILYGNPSGFYPMAVDGDLTVYVSEVLAEKA